MQMVDDKAPSLDDFPCEFYKAYYDFLGSDLHKVYLEAIQNGSLGVLINKGNIKFTSKQGDLELITN